MDRRDRNFALVLLGYLFAGSMAVTGSCASEQAERKHWQDCGGVYHEECVDSPDLRACEYEYYKECIND